MTQKKYICDICQVKELYATSRLHNCLPGAVAIFQSAYAYSICILGYDLLLALLCCGLPKEGRSQESIGAFREALRHDPSIKERLAIASQEKIHAVIGIGYPDEEKPPHPREKLQDEKVFLNSYGSPYSQK